MALTNAERQAALKNRREEMARLMAEQNTALLAENAALRAENRANTIEKSRKKVERGICPYCGKLPIKTSGLSKTCGEPQCIAEHKRVTNREREQRRRISEIEKPIVGLATLGQYSMPCPWESHKLDTLPYGVASWDDPIMDPMSGGDGESEPCV